MGMEAMEDMIFTNGREGGLGALSKLADYGSSPISVVPEDWKDFDLDTAMEQLNEQGHKIADYQESSQENRHKLAEAIRDFKMAGSAEKAELFDGLLKAYAEEIDNLTQRAEFSENAFLYLYQKLYEARDPLSLFSSTAVASARVAELEQEASSMKLELDDLRAESAILKNQQVKVRRLEERNRQLERQTESKIKEMVAAKQQEALKGGPHRSFVALKDSSEDYEVHGARSGAYSMQHSHSEPDLLSEGERESQPADARDVNEDEQEGAPLATTRSNPEPRARGRKLSWGAGLEAKEGEEEDEEQGGSPSFFTRSDTELRTKGQKAGWGMSARLQKSKSQQDPKEDKDVSSFFTRSNTEVRQKGRIISWGSGSKEEKKGAKEVPQEEGTSSSSKSKQESKQKGGLLSWGSGSKGGKKTRMKFGSSEDVLSFFTRSNTEARSKGRLRGWGSGAKEETKVETADGEEEGSVVFTRSMTEVRQKGGLLSWGSGSKGDKKEKKQRAKVEKPKEDEEDSFVFTRSNTEVRQKGRKLSWGSSSKGETKIKKTNLPAEEEPSFFTRSITEARPIRRKGNWCASTKEEEDKVRDEGDEKDDDVSAFFTRSYTEVRQRGKAGLTRTTSEQPPVHRSPELVKSQNSLPSEQGSQKLSAARFWRRSKTDSSGLSPEESGSYSAPFTRSNTDYLLPSDLTSQASGYSFSSIDESLANGNSDSFSYLTRSSTERTPLGKKPPKGSARATPEKTPKKGGLGGILSEIRASLSAGERHGLGPNPKISRGARGRSANGSQEGIDLEDKEGGGGLPPRKARGHGSEAGSQQVDDKFQERKQTRPFVAKSIKGYSKSGEQRDKTGGRHSSSQSGSKHHHRSSPHKDGRHHNTSHSVTSVQYEMMRETRGKGGRVGLDRRTLSDGDKDYLEVNLQSVGQPASRIGGPEEAAPQESRKDFSFLDEDDNLKGSERPASSSAAWSIEHLVDSTPMGFRATEVEATTMEKSSLGDLKKDDGVMVSPKTSARLCREVEEACHPDRMEAARLRIMQASFAVVEAQQNMAQFTGHGQSKSSGPKLQSQKSLDPRELRKSTSRRGGSSASSSKSTSGGSSSKQTPKTSGDKSLHAAKEGAGEESGEEPGLAFWKQRSMTGNGRQRAASFGGGVGGEEAEGDGGGAMLQRALSMPRNLGARIMGGRGSKETAKH